MGKIKLKQHKELPDRPTVDAASHLVILLPATGTGASWRTFPYGDVLKARLRRLADADPGKTPLLAELPNSIGTRVTLATVADTVSAFELLTLARRLVTPHLAMHPTTLLVLVPGLDRTLAARAAEAVLAATAAATAPLPQFKSGQRPSKPRGLSIEFFGLQRPVDFARALAEAEGNNLARYLTALPPNQLTPGQYRKRLAVLAREHGWEMKFLSLRELQRRKAGAFLAVAQGDPRGDAGIAHLRYLPKARGNKAPLALVGKGICFDTGGVNLKPAKFMHGMHEDMEGSAVALGCLLALTRLKVDFRIDCWLALAENHIGPSAYKPNDVVTAVNGTTIEIMHTDAEGRMVLADTLAIAAREKPGLLIDFATLTGACVHALSTRYSGAFTNQDDLVAEVIASGKASGERVWPFPIDSDFDSALESQVADIKQCTLEGEADHILAARFLSRFVPAEIAWLHVDLSAGNHKGGLGHIPTDVTGFGVRFALNLVLDRDWCWRNQ